jgi:hypothetical protein
MSHVQDRKPWTDEDFLTTEVHAMVIWNCHDVGAMMRLASAVKEENATLLCTFEVTTPDSISTVMKSQNDGVIRGTENCIKIVVVETTSRYASQKTYGHPKGKMAVDAMWKMKKAARGTCGHRCAHGSLTASEAIPWLRAIHDFGKCATHKYKLTRRNLVCVVGGVYKSNSSVLRPPPLYISIMKTVTSMGCDTLVVTGNRQKRGRRNHFDILLKKRSKGPLENIKRVIFAGAQHPSFDRYLPLELRDRSRNSKAFCGEQLSSSFYSISTLDHSSHVLLVANSELLVSLSIKQESAWACFTHQYRHLKDRGSMVTLLMQQPPFLIHETETFNGLNWPFSLRQRLLALIREYAHHTYIIAGNAHNCLSASTRDGQVTVRAYPDLGQEGHRCFGVMAFADDEHGSLLGVKKVWVASNSKT